MAENIDCKPASPHTMAYSGSGRALGIGLAVIATEILSQAKAVVTVIFDQKEIVIGYF